MIRCKELAEILGVSPECCWGCHENEDTGAKPLHIIKKEASGLPDDAYVCCWILMEWDNLKEKKWQKLL